LRHTPPPSAVIVVIDRVSNLEIKASQRQELMSQSRRSSCDGETATTRVLIHMIDV